MKSYQEFFAELKRRRVFRVMAVYGIVGFVLLQIVDLVVPALLLPDWTYRFVALILMLGFPVAVVLAWAFEMTPAGMHRTTPAAPGELGTIIAAPASQRWPAGLMALVGVAALVASTWWIARSTAPEATSADTPTTADVRFALADPADDTRPSLAVLPFVNMSSDEEQEYFSDGMTEEILNSLVKIRDLRVAGRTSAFAYKDQTKDLREIGSELGVAYLVEGSVRKDGEQLRITAQLIDAADGSHLWSETYDRLYVNVFQIQSEIAEAIADALTVPLGLAGASSLVTPTGDLEAYDLYLAGRSRLRERAEGVFDAVDLFEAAVARDSAWAPAWAGLADAIALQIWYADFADGEVPFEETLAEAEVAARRALDLNPQNPTGLIVLGNVHRDRFQWSEAEQYYRRALELDPDNPEAHQQYAEMLHKQGRVAEAVRSIDRAAALDPSGVRVFQLQYILVSDERLDESEEVVRWAVSQGALDFFALQTVFAVMSTRRAYFEGRYGDMTVPWNGWIFQVDSAGWGEYVRALETGRLDLVPDSLLEAVRNVMGAADLIRFGEPDRAVELLLRLMKMAGGSLTTEFASWPIHDSIRNDPRVLSYMASIGIEDFEVQRTPFEDRVRPAILRQADAARAAAGSAEKSAP